MSSDRGLLASNQSRRLSGDWSANEIPLVEFECAYCGNRVGFKRGFVIRGQGETFIAICYLCNRPTYFESGRRYPGLAPGRPVEGVMQEVADLYDEARNAAGVGAYTTSVIACRKILMNVAVSEQAAEGLTFVECINHLEGQHLFSPKMRPFVDYIRRLGNEANHEIRPKTEHDATAVIEFVGAVLRHNYEVPGKLPAP